MSNYINYTDTYTGLRESEVEERTKMYGFNSDSRLEESGKGFSPISVFVSLRFVLMIIVAALYIMSENILGAIITILLLGVYVFTQVYKGTKCDEYLYKLKRSSDIKFRVIRGNEIVLLRKEYIVPDDIIILQAGESVPADAHLLEISELLVDESYFTNSNEPVVKKTGADSRNELKQTCVYKGTRIIGGNLVARVFATGVDTKKFQIYGSSETEEEYYTNFENTINKLSPIFSMVSVVMLIAVIIYSFIGINSDHVLDIIIGTLFPAVSFALCFLPAEIGSFVRVYYIYNALRLSKSEAIIKDLVAFEALNAVSAICIDKSGIITKNKIEVAEEYTKDPAILSKISILSCDTVNASAFDQAIILNASFRHIDVKELTSNELLCTYPYTENTKLGGNLWRIGNARLMCIKGAPENVFTVCKTDPEQLFSLQKRCTQYAKQGFQMIVVAFAKLQDDQIIPDSIYDLEYTYAGIIAFNNQTRDSVPAAIRNCYRAGVKVIMTTGDNAETAAAIGKKIGLTEGTVITGNELKSAIELGDKIDTKNINIFAAITSEQKIDIIKLLKKNNEIVAVIGDNNTPLEVLDEADISIAMMQNTSGSAKEASDMIVSDDNFDTIVNVLKEARQMHSNIKSATSIGVSILLAIILFAVFDMILIDGFVLTPLITLLLNIVMIPAAILHYLNNRIDAKNIYKPSGFIGVGVINPDFIKKTIFQALGFLVGLLIIFALLGGQEIGVVRAGVFATAITSLITVCYVNFSRDKSVIKTLKGNLGIAPLLTGLMLLVMLIVIYVPFVNTAFGISMLNPLLLLVSLIIGVLSHIWQDFLKKKPMYDEKNEKND